MATFQPPLGARVDWGHHQSQGLIGLWIPNAGSGTEVEDLAEVCRQARLGAGITWNSADAHGYSLAFPNTGYPRLAVDRAVPNLSLTNMTVGCWIKTSDDGQGVFSLSPSNAFSLIIGDMTGLGYAAHYGATSGKLAMIIEADSQKIESASGVNDGNWHFVVAVRDVHNNEGRIYVDGILETTAALSGTTAITFGGAGSSICLWGAFQADGDAGDANFYGSLGAMYIFDQPLNDSAVAELYAFPYGMLEHEPTDFITLIDFNLPTPDAGSGQPDPIEPGGEGPPTEPENTVSTALPFGTEYGLVCMLDDSYKSDGWSQRGTILAIDATEADLVIRLTVSGIDWITGASYEGMWGLITSGTNEDIWFQIDSVDQTNNYIYLAGLRPADLSFTPGDQFDLGAMTATRDFAVVRPDGSALFRAVQIDHAGASGDSDDDSMAELYLDTFSEDLGPDDLQKSGRTQIDDSARGAYPWKRLEYDADSGGTVSPRSSRFRFRLRARVRDAMIRVRQLRLLGKAWRR